MTALADVKREALKISNMWDISSYCFSAWLQEKLGQISTKRLSYPPNALLLVTCSPTPKPTAPPVSKAHSLGMRSTCAVECDRIWMNRTNRRTCTAPTAKPVPHLVCYLRWTRMDFHKTQAGQTYYECCWQLAAKLGPSPSWSMVHPVHLQRISLACYCSCLHPFSDGNKKHPPKPKRWCPSDS